jgi:HSP20 family protein
VILMVMRFDPFGDVDRLTRQLVDRARDTASTVAMDAYRRGDEVVVHFDLPGVDSDSIEVTAEQNTVTVRASREWRPQPDEQVIAQERPQGSFVRQLMLGEHLDTGQVEAAYDGGVLTLRIPVAPEAKPRKIEVRGGRQQEALTVSGSSGSSDGESQ